MEQATEMSIDPAEFKAALVTMLEEVFVNVHGYTLDRGTSLMETISGVSADEASMPMYTGGSNIAAQVNHVCFYIDGLLDLIATGEPKKRDWPSSWAVGAVSSDEWQALTARLQAAYDAIRALPDATPRWDRMTIGGAIALVSHTSYHLGEIRLGLGVLRS